MAFLKRLFGICETRLPSDGRSWSVNDGVIRLDLEKASELASPGSALRLEGQGMKERILVVHRADGQFYAYVNRCAHMGRRIDPLPDGESLQCCSVSKSTYTYSGELLSGPAKGAIKTLPVKQDQMRLEIRLT